eukprot:1946345-Rhodomonas_salina.2
MMGNRGPHRGPNPMLALHIGNGSKAALSEGAQRNKVHPPPRRETRGSEKSAHRCNRCWAPGEKGL